MSTPRALPTNGALPPQETADGEDVLMQIESVGVRFGDNVVLDRISFTVPRGQTLAIIGESGCGKTVLLKVLVGLVAPTSGQVRFKGTNLHRLNDFELTRVRREMGFVFQQAALFDSMTIGQNVAFPLRQHTSLSDEETRMRVERGLYEVGLPRDVMDKYPAEISGGMRKRAGLARALILEPELVVYDEPTTGLDPIMSDVVNELMLVTRGARSMTSILVTHDMRSAQKVADRVVMLYPYRRLPRGANQVLYDGPPDGLESSPDPRVRQFVRGEAGERLMEMRADLLDLTESRL
jgi:phospholipid/cholesterol/gamma-HCH transport system ATP-binding protein